MKAFFGAKTARRIAATIPALDTAKARCGTPLVLRRPSQPGAYLPLDSENSIRVERYKFVFALERAAVMTTRFMMPAANGIPAVAKARTNGLPAMLALPIRSQGVIASITVTARR